MHSAVAMKPPFRRARERRFSVAGRFSIRPLRLLQLDNVCSTDKSAHRSYSSALWQKVPVLEDFYETLNPGGGSTHDFIGQIFFACL